MALIQQGWPLLRGCFVHKLFSCDLGSWPFLAFLRGLAVKRVSTVHRVVDYLLGQKTCVLSPPPLCIQVEFRTKYKVPLILDESVTFGVLGATGRGATEHFGLDVR